MPSHRAPRRRPLVRAVVFWCALGLGVVLLACAAWVTVRGLIARATLEDSIALASAVQRDIGEGDNAAAVKNYEKLSERASSARDLTSDPIWRVAELIPLVGTNLVAVRELTTVVSTVTDEAIGPLARLAGSFDLSNFKPVGGILDIQPLVDARPTISTAAETLRHGLEQVNSIEPDFLIQPVSSAVARVAKTLGNANTAADAVDRAVRLLPGMLGTTGEPRHYLVLFQNNAELRTTGGISGAVALVRADHGKIDLVEQASSSDFPHYTTPVIDLPTDTRGVFGDNVGGYIQDVNLTPRFPISALAAQEMWKRQFGTAVDGVLAVDPVTLSYVLKATGPITLPSGEKLTSSNAVATLLSEAYAKYAKPADQDQFFADAASTVFSAVAHGDFEPRAMIAALARAGSEHRVLLWSAHDDEQEIITPTTLAGQPPTSTVDSPAFGVYFNDATRAKMDYYLDVNIAVGQATCRADDRPTYLVDVTLRNTAPADAATSLPPYVTGNGAYGVTPGNIATNVVVYGPSTALLLSATANEQEFPYHPAVDEGQPVGQYDVELAPGEEKTVRLEFVGAAPSAGPIRVEMTPMIKTHAVKSLHYLCGTP